MATFPIEGLAPNLFRDKVHPQIAEGGLEKIDLVLVGLAWALLWCWCNGRSIRQARAADLRDRHRLSERVSKLEPSNKLAPMRRMEPPIETDRPQWPFTHSG